MEGEPGAFSSIVGADDGDYDVAVGVYIKDGTVWRTQTFGKCDGEPDCRIVGDESPVTATETTTAAPTTAAPEEHPTTAAPEEHLTTAAPVEHLTTVGPVEHTTTALPEELPATDAPEKNPTTAAPKERRTTKEKCYCK